MLWDVFTGLLMNFPAILVYLLGTFLHKRRKWCMGFFWFGTLVLQGIPLFGGIAGMIRNPTVWVTTAQITYVISAPVLSILFFIMMKKVSRKASFTPAIPVDKTTCGSIDPDIQEDQPIQKPKQPIFGRYDTYITCPGCGQLVPKGAKQCDCGYDLSGTLSKVGRCLRRIVPVLIVIFLLFASGILGYRVGQKSIASQFSAQYDAGETAGYKAGYQKGLHDGLIAASHSNTSEGGYLIPID